MTKSDWPGPRGRERSMSLEAFEVFQKTQAKLKADREAKDAEYEAALKAARDAADEIERLREALHSIACNTEPDAIKHRDYDHLAQSIYACARAALGEEK